MLEPNHSPKEAHAMLVISGVKSLIAVCNQENSHVFSLGGSKMFCRPLNLQSKLKRKIGECMFGFT